MSDKPGSPHETGPLFRRRQYSLYAMLTLVTILSVGVAAFATAPKHLAFAVSMLMLFLFPLVTSTLLCSFILNASSFAGDCQNNYAPFASFMHYAARWLGLAQSEREASLVASLITGITSMVVLIASWPLMREVGQSLSLLTLQPINNYTYTLNEAARRFSQLCLDFEYWKRIWHWEMWSVGRWWLLFGGIFILWLVVCRSLRGRLALNVSSPAVSRLFTFAPWIVVLEVSFLIGVWIKSPATVPEPSTGFFVGIYDWGLWHWDCWLDRGWLIRGAVPVLVTSLVFFRQVLQWRWLAALGAALSLVPVSLILSVAWNVTYRHWLL